MGEIEDLKEVLKNTFSKIKSDITLNSDAVNELNSKITALVKENKALYRQIAELNSLLNNVKSAKPVIKKSVSSKKINELSETSNSFREELDELSQKIIELSSKFASLGNNKPLDEAGTRQLIKDEIKSLQSSKASVQKQNIQERMLKQFDKKRKDIIKHKILELSSQSQMTLPELKEIIVDQSGYCSKASFYRYIERMKLRSQIDFVELNGISIIVPSKALLRQK